MTALFARRPLGRAAVPLCAAFAAAALLVAGAGLQRHGERGPVLKSPVAESRTLHFHDDTGGSVTVVDANGRLVATFSSGEGSFMRGVLRSLARERRAQNRGAEAPFRLARHVDGRMSLEDPTNGQVVVLDAFGTTNAGLFAGLLRTQGAAR
jgi:putative photosynthetic complex assembly protein